MEKYYDDKGIFINYYEMIGVNKDASTEEIIRKGNSAIMFAGDISRSNANMEKVSEKEKYQYFLAIMEAVKVLSNSETRAEYDAVYKKEMAKSSQENESNLQSNEQLENLLKENENLRKLNDEREEYIKELERKLSTKSNQETIDDYKEDEDITDEEIEAMIKDAIAEDKDFNNFDLASDKTHTNIKNINIDLDSEENKNIEQPTDNDKVENNKEEDKKEIVDNKHISKDTEEEPQKVVKTEEVDKDAKLRVKGEGAAKGILIGVGVVSAIALLGILYSVNSTKRADKIKEDNGLDINPATTSVIGAIEGSTEVEETQEEIEVEPTPVVEEEPYEVSLDANSETVILQTISDIEQEISKVNDPIVKDMFNHETIEALVRYTRDNTILSGETAYENFQVLFENGVDVSMFFKNLDEYQVINTLQLSVRNIDQNNDSFDDENNAYNAIDAAVDYLSPDDYAAIWCVSVMSDAAVNTRSMLAAADEAVENGLEGVEYQNMMNSVPSAVRENAKRVFNKVKPYDNSYLMKLRLNTLDNEKVRTLG